ncbi:Hypothetical_protein [Hexamita inflata]|uniref:Hypothetical_protein n=1 Tax=Hexamita inflata TaxID=28002 RepID=A0AA86R1N6_9EUKA|nr:Hypothetical protein HINF_LOCUS57741 [Hexamita inflata]
MRSPYYSSFSNSPWLFPGFTKFSTSYTQQLPNQGVEDEHGLISIGLALVLFNGEVCFRLECFNELFLNHNVLLGCDEYLLVVFYNQVLPPLTVFFHTLVVCCELTQFIQFNW